MAMHVHVGLSQKLGRPNYGSIGASCQVEFEIDGSLLRFDPAAFQRQIHQAYHACRSAVEHELATQVGGNGDAHPAPRGAVGRESTRRANGSSVCGSPSAAPASHNEAHNEAHNGHRQHVAESDAADHRGAMLSCPSCEGQHRAADDVEVADGPAAAAAANGHERSTQPAGNAEGASHHSGERADGAAQLAMPRRDEPPRRVAAKPASRESPATRKQIGYIRDLARSVDGFSNPDFDRRLAELSTSQASDLIGVLQDVNRGEADLAAILAAGAEYPPAGD